MANNKRKKNFATNLQTPKTLEIIYLYYCHNNYSKTEWMWEGGNKYSVSTSSKLSLLACLYISVVREGATHDDIKSAETDRWGDLYTLLWVSLDHIVPLVLQYQV